VVVFSMLASWLVYLLWWATTNLNVAVFAACFRFDMFDSTLYDFSLIHACPSLPLSLRVMGELFNCQDVVLFGIQIRISDSFCDCTHPMHIYSIRERVYICILSVFMMVQAMNLKV